MREQQRPTPHAADEELDTLHNRAPWINVVVGILVFVSRWVIHPTTFAADWNLFLTGAAIVIAAMIAAGAHGNVTHNYWSAVNVAAGLWLIVSVAIVANTAAMTWTQICLGVITITAALTSLSNERLFTRRLLRSSTLRASRR